MTAAVSIISRISHALKHGLTYLRALNISITAGRFILLMTLLNLIVFNFPVFTYALDNLDVFSWDGIEALLSLTVVISLFTSVFLYLLFCISQKLVKPIIALLLMGNAISLYFILTYQVLLTKEMMGNMFNTDVDEATELFDVKIIAYLVLYALIPAYFLFKIRFKPVYRFSLIKQASAVFIVSVLWIYMASSSWLWIDKHAKVLGSTILPWSYIINTGRYAGDVSAENVEQTLLPDAHFTANRKTVVFLVLGETARANNFSLYGYDRETNPKLKQEGVIALKDATSCATYTTASLKCMLSHDNESSVFAGAYEPLPSYLQRNGVEVIWRSNNWGEPKINVSKYTRASELKKTCEGSGCSNDAVLLKGLSTEIAQSKSDKILVVLHQKGSHGPLYSKRYDAKFEKFTPVCNSVELSECSSEELINAYDNTILYNDDFLTNAINILKGQHGTDTMLMYLSDHGESLGEYGLYLHGTPYSLAPDFQKKIPFIVWMSDQFIQDENVDVAKLRAREHNSHDNVFHSIMGAFDMSSSVYRKDLDIFAQ